MNKINQKSYFIGGRLQDTPPSYHVPSVYFFIITITMVRMILTISILMLNGYSD